MRTVALVILSLAIPSLLAAQSGQFIVRLGTDTLAIEQYTRTTDRLQGEQVLRSPRTVHRLYTATFGPGGAIARVRGARTQALAFAALGRACAPSSLGVLAPPDSIHARGAGAAVAVR